MAKDTLRPATSSSVAPTPSRADTPKLGKAEVLLDGWGLKCQHNVFNGLTWGPDGWLYGCNGITATSLP